MTGILITTKAVRYDDFTFVSNRLSSNLANILFLLTASAIGGAAAVTAGFLLKIIAFFLATFNTAWETAFWKLRRNFYWFGGGHSIHDFVCFSWLFNRDDRTGE